jgi:hypothetical protein
MIELQRIIQGEPLKTLLEVRDRETQQRRNPIGKHWSKKILASNIRPVKDHKPSSNGVLSTAWRSPS